MDATSGINIKPSNLTFTSIQSEETYGTASNGEKNEVLLAGSTTSDSGETEKAYQVPISEEAVHYMLISKYCLSQLEKIKFNIRKYFGLGIMILAVIGLIIGLICRKDVGGIKTKCCRTRKPPPGDQTRPGEDIPLNKIA